MPIPVFRVVFSICLVLVCLGAVARGCEVCDINYKFILKADLRSKVQPEYFFSQAAILGTLWVLAFGAYVIDYKWGLISPMTPDDDEETNYSKGASFHFVVYPIILIAAAFFILLWPSPTCRNKYKLAVVGSLGRTAGAPFYTVDFTDNMIGD